MNKEMAKFILEVEPSVIKEHVIIAPCWTPESVGVNSYSQASPYSNKIWNCKIDSKEFSYIITGVGAGVCADIVLSLGYTKCKKALFLGSAGALSPEVNIGDIVIPEQILSAEGFSRYMNKSLIVDEIFKSRYADEDICKKLYKDASNNAKNLKIHCFSGKGVSVATICAQFEHIEEFVENGCKYIDMESSAFLSAVNYNKIRGAVVFCVSDNISINEPIYTVNKVKNTFRKKIRREIIPNIIRSFMDEV